MCHHGPIELLTLMEHEAATDEEAVEDAEEQARIPATAD